MFYEGGHRNGIHKIPFTFFLSLNFLWINSIFIFFIFQIFVQILANSIDITDVTMACVDGVTKLRISIPEDFKSFFKDGGSLVLRIQDPESWKFEDMPFLGILGSNVLKISKFEIFRI